MAEIDPASMIVPPQDKPPPTVEVTEIGAPGDPRAPSQFMLETPIYGTETPYRKTPPTNIGSIAEAGATTTPPTANGISQASAAAAATPVCTALPTITGTVTVGQVLTCGTGTWSPAAASYTYQWFRGDTPINGETAATHTLVTADKTYKMSCRVTGIHATLGGSSFVYTAQTIVVP